MFERIKKLFMGVVSPSPKEYSLNEDLTLTYDMDLSNFEGSWLPGTGEDNHTKGVNHQWFGNGSVVLAESVELHTKHNPMMFDDDIYEYEVGKISSKFEMGLGDYEIDVKLPEGSLLNPSIVFVLSNGTEVTLFEGKTDINGEYIYFGSDLSTPKLHKKTTDDLVINLSITDEKAELFYNGLLVDKVEGVGAFTSLCDGSTLVVTNEHRNEIEGKTDIDESVFVINDIKYFN